jgi:replication factor A1
MSSQKQVTSRLQQIKELTPRSRRVDVVVRVTSLSPTRRVVSRRDRRAHRVAEAVVEDDTGVIRLTLWDDDIAAVRVGETVRVRNGYVKLFKGSMRLAVGPRGALETVDAAALLPLDATIDPSEPPEQRYPLFSSESPQVWWSYGSAV